MSTAIITQTQSTIETELCSPLAYGCCKHHCILFADYTESVVVQPLKWKNWISYHALAFLGEFETLVAYKHSVQKASYQRYHG